MAASNSYVAICSIHTDNVALAVCFNTQELLCFQCCMDKAQTSEKNKVKEIEKISDESEKLLLNCILAKQKVTRKQNLIHEYEERAKAMKENINGQVCELYDQLLEKLGEMRDNTFTSIESKYALFLKTCRNDKKELEKLLKTTNEHLDKVPIANKSEVDSLKSEIEKVMNKLDDIVDYESCPDGSFVAKSTLKDAIGKCGNLFGEFNIYTRDHYEKPESVQCRSGNYKKDQACGPKVPPKPSKINVASEEYRGEKPKIAPRRKSTKVDRPDSEKLLTTTKVSQTPQHIVYGVESTISKVKDSSKDIKSQRRFAIGKTKTSGKLEEYVDVVFVENNFPKARQLINTTKYLSKIPNKFNTPLKFSKLITVDPSRVGLLSKEHSSIFVTGLDGNIQDSKTYEKDQLISIESMADYMIAVLKNKETEIEIIEVNCKGNFQLKKNLKLTLDISKVTGFDYSRTKSQFAIGTESQYVLLDKKGNTVTTSKRPATSKSLDIMSTYDFEKRNIFIINKTKKSMKCVAFKNWATVWKRKCEDPLFQPESAYLHQQMLCIASPRAITLFSKKEGKPEGKQETDDLVKDCFGICVIDDEVIVFSSYSDDFEESKKLGFIGL